jgi:hypothetical protein
MSSRSWQLRVQDILERIDAISELVIKVSFEDVQNNISYSNNGNNKEKPYKQTWIEPNLVAAVGKLSLTTWKFYTVFMWEW